MAVAPSGEFSVVAMSGFLAGNFLYRNTFARVLDSDGTPKTDPFVIDDG